MTLEWWQSDRARPGLEEALRLHNARDSSPSPPLPFRALVEIFPASDSLAGLLTDGIPEGLRPIVWESPECRRLEDESGDLREAMRALREAPCRRTEEAVLRALGGLLDVVDGTAQECVAREAMADVLLEALLAQPSGKLAVYGTLAPGEVNHKILDGINGTWTDGFVRGSLLETGWGAPLGFPALRWDPSRAGIPVKLLVSSDLRGHWDRLDEFEGEEYRRILVPVEEDGATIAVANIYAVNEIRDQNRIR